MALQLKEPAYAKFALSPEVSTSGCGLGYLPNLQLYRLNTVPCSPTLSTPKSFSA